VSAPTPQLSPADEVQEGWRLSVRPFPTHLATGNPSNISVSIYLPFQLAPIFNILFKILLESGVMDHRMQQLHLRRAWMQQRDPILCLSASDYIRKRERFKYDPLSQSAGTETIRLIKLLPGEAFAPIECTIFHIPLSQAYLHPYEALSYCWGDQTSKQAIMSNGMCIEVTFNLFTALYYLRRKDEPRILWVDAICP
jgi:hypothetical protein